MPYLNNQLFPRRRTSRHGIYGSGNNNQIAGLLAAVVERMDQRDIQLMAFMAAQPKRRAPISKTPITREHEARAKALYAEGTPISKIGEAIGISRSAASMLVHGKYPFSVAQH